MNMFAEYGLEASPPRNGPAPSREKVPSALEKKLEERQRLTRAYRAAKREERIAILAEEPRLLDFMRYLRRLTINDGDELLEALADSWLINASADVRHFALHLVGRRTDKLRQSVGLTELDDPLPPDTSVFTEARRLLTAAGERP